MVRAERGRRRSVELFQAGVLPVVGIGHVGELQPGQVLVGMGVEMTAFPGCSRELVVP